MKLTFIDQPKIKSLFQKWNSMSDIPNEEGFNLIVLLANEQQVIAKVVKDNKTQLHSLDISKHFAWQELLGWRQFDNNEIELIKK